MKDVKHVRIMHTSVSMSDRPLPFYSGTLLCWTDRIISGAFSGLLLTMIMSNERRGS